MESYTWEVEGTLPRTHAERKWRRPVWFITEAPTIEEALEKVKAKHPEIVFVKAYRSRHVEGIV